jgi:hypothetical protein
MHTKMADAFGYDWMGNAPALLAEVDRTAIETGNYRRVNGDTICEHCLLPYRLHPDVQGATWLKRSCVNGLVKL